MNFNNILKNSGIAQNHEGATANRLIPEMELYTAVVTMALQDKFYETANEQVDRIAKLIGQVDPQFVAKLAVYTRNEMHLRSIPMLLVVELAKVHTGDDLVSRTIDKVVMRADEIMELLMCYQWRNKRSGYKKLTGLSHQIQVGLQRAFNRFDEYQFAKYNRDNLEVKLRDALFIVHPKAKDETQQAIFDKIASRTLETPYTWETELSAVGQKQYKTPEMRQAAFTEKWSELIRSGRIGYMALMRNLRNMLGSKVCYEDMKLVAERIADAHEVERSQQLPFRYLSAYNELASKTSPTTTMMLNALEDAVQHTAASIKGIDEDSRILLACDTSGSMWQRLSAKSSVMYYDIGLLLAMLLQNRCKQVVSGMFGDIWKVINMPSKCILSNTMEMRRREGEVGYSTNGEKPLKWLIQNHVVMDKVMIFTDCQFWNEGRGNYAQMFRKTWLDYKKIAPEAKLYLFDLAGYGHSPLSVEQNDVYCIAGWSDRIFDILNAIEHGKNAITVINEIEL